MTMIRYILLSLFILAICPGQAQRDIEINWSTYAQDSVLPLFVHSVDLGYKHEGTYTAEIAYPELKPLTNEEVKRFGLPPKGGAPEWPEITTYKGISAKRGQLDVSFSPIIWRDGRYWRIASFSLNIHHAALAAKREVANGAVERYAAHSVLASGRWVKVRVADNGVHMLTHSALKSMGFNNPEQVRLYGYGGHLLSESDVDSWRDDLCEVPLWREADRVLFYANGPLQWLLESDNTFAHVRNPYSQYGYYFLTEDASTTPMTFPVLKTETQQQGEPIMTTPSYTLHEVDDYAWLHAGRQLVESYDYQNGPAKCYSLVTDGVVNEKEATLDVCFTHNGAEATMLSVMANDNSLGTLRLSPLETHSVATSGTAKYTVKLNGKGGKQEVVLIHNRPAGVSGRLDYLRLNYTRMIAPNVPIYATAEGANTYEVAGADEHMVVWNVTDASSPMCIPSSLKDGNLLFSVDGERGDIYVALNPKVSYPMPEVIGEVPNQDLHATMATDYIMIVPANGLLIAQAERLADVHRKRSGLTVKVVRADEVYNEFSSGTPDATAYRRYMKMLYDRAVNVGEAPKYLLLFGDGAWDNRMLSSAWKGLSPDDYLLCYEAENSFNATSSYVAEDYFGLLDDGEGVNLKREKVDVGVGRIPVTMVSQAREVVDKIIAYMDNVNTGAWKNTILMLGDDGDQNRHMDDAEFVAQMLEQEYPDYMIKRVYWDAFPMEKKATGNSYPAVYKRLLELFDEGALMVNYSGHGAPDVISHEMVINKQDMAKLRSPRLPVWVTASCDIAPFDNSVESFGEAAFLNPNGGAIGLLTSTRTTYAEQNRRINYLFSKYVFARDENNRRLSLGDAMRVAKCEMITTSDASLSDKSNNKLNYVLIGDPALIVGTADYRVVVDQLNGMPISDASEVMLKAGSQVVVKGHVDGLSGVRVNDFSGMIYASVFDNVEAITCRNNAKSSGLSPFVYRERTKKFFTGSDSVRNGEFSFTFRIPMDINYSNDSGLINLYAVDSTYTQEATGSYDGFLLGGTEDNLTNDGTGPAIQVFLNSLEFVSGDKVNETPRLMAIIEDPDGINTAGNLGHNLSAIIDGKASMTYNLNEYYISDIGGYTRGTVAYVFPELPEGKHTLMLRAWDMMNNSSTVTVEFEVVRGLSPSIIQMVTMPSPARDYATFTLMHDRPENEVTVTLEVFDFSGRIVWNHTEQVVSSDNTYSYTWNLRGSSGQPLESGVYLYRFVVSSPTGQSSSKAQKILIRR